MNSDKKIAVYDNEVLARTYLSYIAESAEGFATIGRDGKLYIKNYYEDTAEISLELFAEFKWGEEFKISKVSYEDGVRSFKFGDETRNNIWISQENMYIVDEDQIQKIYNKAKGMVINSFEGRTIIDPAIDIGDKLIIGGKSVIYQGEMDFQTRFIIDIKSKIAIKQKEETTIREQSQKVINRKVKSDINQIEGTITLLAEETLENTQDIAKLEVTTKEVVVEVGKKLDEDEFSTKLQVDYQSVLIAWNKVSEFIQFINAQLQIKDANKKILMALDKTGMHFYNDSGKLIGDVGVIKTDSSNQIAFAINGNESGNEMVWGINKTINSKNTFFPVFRYSGYNTQEGTGYGGIFTLEAPVLMQENSLFLGQSTNEDSIQIKAKELNGQGGITARTENYFTIKNANNDDIFFVNNGYFKIGEIVETFINMYGNYTTRFDSVINATGNIYSNGDISANGEVSGTNIPHNTTIGTFYAGFYGNQKGQLMVMDKNSSNYFFLDTTTSDKKAKKNIKVSKHKGIDKIKKIKHKEFDWKNTDKHTDIGYVAQELEEIDEDFVNYHETEIEGKKFTGYTINTLSLLSTTTKAIQEQQKQIEKLQEKDKQKDKIIKDLIKRIESLEKGGSK